MNLRALAKDVHALATSQWLGNHRLQAASAAVIDRWNDYSPIKWKPEFNMALHYGDRTWRLPLRMATDNYGAFREIFLYGYYDQDLGNPKTILDLGGYCGYTAIAFSARFPNARIAAVEPHPENFAVLSENIHSNGLSVTAIQAAAAPVDGTVKLFLGDGMTHGLMPTHHSNGKEITVAALSIDSLLSRLGWDSIDLLKIDIEGAEELLFGAQPKWLAKVKIIIGEFHGDYQVPQLQRDLEPFGFEVRGLPHPGIFMAERL